eukprot:Rmarinus@m.12440
MVADKYCCDYAISMSDWVALLGYWWDAHDLEEFQLNLLREIDWELHVPFDEFSEFVRTADYFCRVRGLSTTLSNPSQYLDEYMYYTQMNMEGPYPERACVCERDRYKRVYDQIKGSMTSAGSWQAMNQSRKGGDQHLARIGIIFTGQLWLRRNDAKMTPKSLRLRTRSCS